MTDVILITSDFKVSSAPDNTTTRNYSTESNRFYYLMFLPSEHTSSILLISRFFFLLHQPEHDQTVTTEMDKEGPNLS